MTPSHDPTDGHPIPGRATFAERVAVTQQRLLGTCVHFTGLQQPQCQAGVPYWPVGPQPCLLRYDTGKHRCALRRFPEEATAYAEAVTQEQRGDEAMARFWARWAAQECLQCGTAYTALRQVGRCVYADPCGHRQYQGRVPQAAKDRGHG